jgi:Protein of unknown function (DUF3592)
MGFVYASLFGAFGVLALWGARYVNREIRRVRGWATVPGRILERGVGEPMSNRTFMPHVVYTYEVDGVAFTNDQVYLIRRTSNLKRAIEKLVEGLPNPVPVHYDPASPGSSYLLKNPRATVWMLRAFGALALLLSLMQLIIAA